MTQAAQKKPMTDLLLSTLKNKGTYKSSAVSQIRLSDLSDILENLEEQSQLTLFLQKLQKQKIIKIQELQKQFQMQLKEIRWNFGSIVAEIYKQKHSEVTALQIINGESDVKKLDGYYGVINSPDYFFHIRGVVSDMCWLKNKKSLAFNIKQSDNKKCNVRLFIHKHIESMEIMFNNHYPLEQQLNHIFQTKGNGETETDQCEIKVEKEKFKAFSNVLPDGKYKLNLLFKEEKLQRIVFINVMDDEKEFNIIYKPGKDPMINHQDWGSTMYYRHFIKGLKIIKTEHKIVSFSNDQKLSNNCFKLRKPCGDSNEFDVIQIMQKINEQKTEAIQVLLHTNLNLLLIGLIDKLITVQDFTNEKHFCQQIFQRHEFQDILKILKRLQQYYSKINFHKTVEQILKDILNEANYLLLVPKQDSIDTIRIVSLLTQAIQMSAMMKDKDIITFYGPTGAGKSTSINYLMGIPLIRETNNYGDKIIKINDVEFQKLKQEMIQNRKTAEIGHKIGTSQTIYSQGHEFIESRFGDKIKKIVRGTMLCDNPGFGDTRGTEYEILTSMSIDVAINNAKRIRAIVLTIPYASFTADRSNNIFSLLSTLEERYPHLLKDGTATHKCFHILITKWSSNKEIQKFRNRLTTYIQQEQKQRAETIKNKSGAGASQGQRLYIYKILLSMYEQDRIKFINVTNNFAKQELIGLYLTNNCVPKEMYQKFMETGDQKEKLLKQLSKSAHTWTIMLLYPFSDTIPRLIKEAEQKITTLIKDVEDRLKYIQQNKKMKVSCETNLSKWRQEQKKHKKTYKVEAISITQFQSTHQFIDLNAIQIDQQEKRREYENKLSTEGRRLKQFENKIRNQKLVFEKKLKQCEQQRIKIRDLQRLIKSLSTGSIIEQLYNLRYSHGQKLFFNTRRKRSERQKAFENFIQLRELEQKGFIVVGEQAITLLYLPVISREYQLMPNKEFDPDAYIKAHNQNLSFSVMEKKNKGTVNQYQAKFESNGVVLNKVKNSPDGKKVIMDIEVQLKVCDKQSQLPYLRITHEIPNCIANSSTIDNRKSELNQSINTLNILVKQQQLQKTTYENYKAEKRIIQQHIKKIEQELIETNQIHRMKIEDNIKNMIQKETANIVKYDSNIKQLQDMNKKERESLKQTKKKFQTYKFTYRRIAYLIRSQVNQQIPQSLVRLIKDAIDVDNFTKDNDQRQDRDEKLDQMKNFKIFIQLFEDKKESLLSNIQKVLDNKKYCRVDDNGQPSLRPDDIEEARIENIQIDFTPPKTKKPEKVQNRSPSQSPNPPEVQKSCCQRYCLLF